MPICFDIPTHHCFTKNVHGTDYFVGDIHGEYTILLDSLKSIDFDFDSDRLFSTGDVIDRGENSFKCLQLSNEKWFYPIIGNHEQFLMKIEDGNFYYQRKWFKNGGDWWEQLSIEDKLYAKKLVRNNFSLTNTVETIIGNVGVVHAEYPFGNWPLDNEQALTLEDKQTMLWGRKILKEKNELHTNGVTLLISGHTPIDEPLLIGNQLFIDTGCGHQPNEKIYTPHLTICEIKDNVVKFFSLNNGFYTIEL